MLTNFRASPRKVANIFHEAFCDDELDTSLASPSTPISIELDSSARTSKTKLAPPPTHSTIQTAKVTTPRPFTHRMKSFLTKPTPLLAEDSIDSIDTPPTPEQGKILLVEDNRINLKILSQYMGKLSEQYVLATNGREALEAYTSSKEPIDLILMDVQMPIMDGLEATREIRRWEVKNGMSPTAVVALTAATGDDVRGDAYSSGMDAFLVKPVEMKVLRRVMEKLREGGRAALREFGNIG
jgi:CheY-like chemotaxis protein